MAATEPTAARPFNAEEHRPLPPWPEARRRLAGVYASKYQWQVTVRDGALWGEGAPTAGPPPYHVYVITPTAAFGFGTDETFGATRWRFLGSSSRPSRRGSPVPDRTGFARRP
jgi:hypothetical protein